MQSASQGPATEDVETVIHQYADMVYRMAYAWMRSKADAEDVFQDVFLSYAQKHPVFQDEGHRRAWLLRVTVNRCKSLHRSAWRRHRASLEEARTAAVPAPEFDDLHQALSRLPARYRAVIHLYYFENYSTQEIAALLHLPHGTVRTQMTRARRLLGDMLQGDEPDVL